MMGDMRLNKPWFCVKEGINFNLTCYQALLLSECGILLIRKTIFSKRPVKYRSGLWVHLTSSRV